MGTVRPFRIDDVPPVADLFWRVFRHKQGPAPASLRDCFQELHLSYPSGDLPLGSLVYEDGQGKVRGFIGGTPLRLSYREKRIWALVAGNHMVDPGLAVPMAGARLLREFLAGPQQLTYSDTANGVSSALWRALGGHVLLANSAQWVRVLRPSLFALDVAKKWAIGRALALPLCPLCSVADLVGARLLNRSLGESVARLEGRELEVDTMLGGFGQFAEDRALLPDYDREGLARRLSLAGGKRECGPLVATGVYESGRLLGWYLVYAQSGSIAEVLQLVAGKKTVDRVLNHLFSSALERGCLAVMGSVEPRFFEAHSRNKCLVFVRKPVKVAHSRDPEILCDICQGNAFLSRLEGEWWMPLQGDEFV